MNAREADTPRHWVAPAYYTALLLVLTGAFDFFTNVWPLTPGDIRWRFGTGGLLAGFLITPILGAVVGLATATIAGHRTAVRLISILLWVAAALHIATLVAFTLDTVQLRAMMPAEGQASLVVAAVKAMLKHVTALIAFIWLGLAGMRSARDMAPLTSAGPPGKKRGSLLVTEK